MVKVQGPVLVHTGSRLTEPGSTVPGKVHKFHDRCLGIPLTWGPLRPMGSHEALGSHAAQEA